MMQRGCAPTPHPSVERLFAKSPDSTQLRREAGKRRENTLKTTLLLLCEALRLSFRNCQMVSIMQQQ